MEVLERVESSYVPAFKSMLMDVEAGEMLGQLHHTYVMTSGLCSWCHWFQAQSGCNGSGHSEFAVTAGTAAALLALSLVCGVKLGCLCLI